MRAFSYGENTFYQTYFIHVTIIILRSYWFESQLFYFSFVLFFEISKTIIGSCLWKLVGCRLLYVVWFQSINLYQLVPVQNIPLFEKSHIQCFLLNIKTGSCRISHSWVALVADFWKGSGTAFEMPGWGGPRFNCRWLRPCSLTCLTRILPMLVGLSLIWSWEMAG